MYIDTAPGIPVDDWKAKRRRASMYAGESPWVEKSAHRRGAGGFPLTFHDIQYADGDLFKDPEDVIQNRGSREGPNGGVPEVIEKKDDDPVVLEPIQVRPEATQNQPGPPDEPCGGSG